MKIIKNFLKIIFCIFLTISLILILLYIYVLTIPKIDLNNINNISIYDNNEELIFNGSGSKEWIDIENISPYLIDATIYTEDKRFYSHKGFDFLRIAKSIYVNIKSNNLSEGASTITQQLARNIFSDFDKTWKRKLKEAWYAFRLEINYTKNEILEAYLNTINYGNGILGIENASYYYFNKSAKDLTLEESAMLAGIPKAPNIYSPINNETLAKQRQEVILNNLVKNNKITIEEKENALNKTLIYHGKKKKYNLSTLMYYKDAVINELYNLDNINKKQIENGINIYTTLDIETQNILETSMNNNMNSNDSLEVAVVAIDPNTGYILGLIGGSNYAITEYNRAVYSKRQVGSTIKPILYYAALENGFTASSTFLSKETTFNLSNNKYTVQNYAQIYPNKEISMSAAIAYSDNIYAVKTHLFLGENVLINMANKIGIDEKFDEIASLALGTKEFNIIDYVGAYATFANLGYKIEPHTIKKITDKEGNTIYEESINKEKILNSDIVYILNDLLTLTYDINMVDYNYPSCISIASKINNKYSVKTGTTDTDAWVIGYNKDIIIGVWNGYDDSSYIDLNATKISKNIWVDSIEGYFKNKETYWYEMPSNVVGALVNPITGKIATKEDNKKKILYYLKGTEPNY